jgi:hypothetical protein
VLIGQYNGHSGLHGRKNGKDYRWKLRISIGVNARRLFAAPGMLSMLSVGDLA